MGGKGKTTFDNTFSNGFMQPKFRPVKIKGNKLENKKEIELLEKFVLDNPDLEKLEDLLSQFNIFETLNVVNAEIRHSNVLAWFLNPNANHSLGGYFLKKFLKYLISHTGKVD